VTSGICELIVGNMDVDSNKGVVVEHACGEVVELKLLNMSFYYLNALVIMLYWCFFIFVFI